MLLLMDHSFRKRRSRVAWRPWLGGIVGVLFAAFTCGSLWAAEGGADKESNPAAGSTLGTVDLKALGMGSWIWAEKSFDKQTCRFWRSITVPASPAVVDARLRITADNGYRFFLDGRELGRGSDWRWISEFDLTLLLSPGPHVLAVEVFNDALEGGLLAGLQIKLADGRMMEMASDADWYLVPEGERGWASVERPRASWTHPVVVGSIGSPPWDTGNRGLVRVPPLQPLPSHFWAQAWFQVCLVLLSAFVVLISLRLAAQLAVQSKAQRLLQRERARIARDIHDDLGAGLTELVLLGEVMQSELRSGGEVRAEVDQLCGKARALCGEMDEVVWTVNSKRDTVRDFATYVCKYALAFYQASPIRCRLDVETNLPSLALDLPVRRTSLLAVKEALNNAAKYSEAGEVHLRIYRRGSFLQVVVEDNGQGFDPDSLTGERNGLRNMQERLCDVGGTCQIFSQPGEGCVVEFAIPIHAARKSSLRWLTSVFRRRGASKSTYGGPGIAEPSPQTQVK